MITFSRPGTVIRKRRMFMLVVNALAFLGAMGFGNWAHADGTVFGGIVTGIYVNEQIGDMAFITVSGTKSSNPSCSAGSYSFVLALSNTVNPEAAQMFTMLVSARIAQTPVTLVGDGACTIYSSTEDLIVVTL